MRMLNVPQEFIPEMEMIYPPHQGHNPLIEKRCFNYFANNLDKIDSDYIYLPVQWTAYHLINGYGQNVQPLIDFYSYVIDQLPNEKFFTIVQYDGGTLVELKNCKVFAASGGFSSPIGENSVYEPIPLLCDPHPLVSKQDKKYKVTFCGRKTHPLRNVMFDQLEKVQDYKLVDTDSNSISSDNVQTFRELISDSIFGLCPRGYGPTSFRLYETIQMGAIPIFISDEFWIPFEQFIDWDKLCLLISPDEISNIPDKVNYLIDSGKYKDMLEYGKFCYDNYFSWDGAVKTIGKMI